MKINHSVTIYTGARQGTAASGAKQGAQKGTKSLFVGKRGLNGETDLRDRLAQRKEQAQKKAMKLVGDVFASDSGIDEDIEKRREHVSELKEEKKQLAEESRGVAKRREDLEKAYEAGEVSHAYYMDEKLSLDREEQTYELKQSENENAVVSENSVIRGTKLERLKSNPMGEARKQADEILAAARDEMIGMIQEDAKEKLDEESAAREEQAKKIKEEREEQQRLIEERRQKNSEQEPQPEDALTEQMVSATQGQTDVQQEVQKLLDRLKLLEEDIKGAAVDEAL